jgi:hypothetical protein
MNPSSEKGLIPVYGEILNDLKAKGKNAGHTVMTRCKEQPDPNGKKRAARPPWK